MSGTDVAGARSEAFAEALARVEDMIPAVLVTAWAGIELLVDAEPGALPPWAFWLLLGFIAVPVTIYWVRMSFSPEELASGSIGRTSERWAQYAITVGAFLVWAYYLGGPFEQAGLHNPVTVIIVIIVWGVSAAMLAELIAFVFMVPAWLWMRASERVPTRDGPAPRPD